ncbi:MAG: phenylalanine--tRNA ligase subunit alpha [Negativicutes bacterium]|nr:phenylalanine--tRNA ligase subunit alpha [Negativicutes bacterium]
MLKSLMELREEALEQLKQLQNSQELNDFKVAYLGKKGKLTTILRQMGKLPEEDRPQFGQIANEIRQTLEENLTERLEIFRQKEQAVKLQSERIDITLPGYPFLAGSMHPISLILKEIKEIFIGLGFTIAEGPEIETDYYDFQALNIPLDHPAREMQDTFYITEDLLLRTQTSPMQARSMEAMAPNLPIKIIVPGKVYRRDEDATHTPMFHQVEGLYVDQNVSLATLKGILLSFARLMFGVEREIRLRPSFFPFTEPSVEVDISCFNCGGKGCHLCKQSGWIEILGAGLVHPNVLRMNGYDPEAVSGLAFGMGVERIAMLKFGIDDMRQMYQNDLRFLNQFRV